MLQLCTRGTSIHKKRFLNITVGKLLWKSSKQNVMNNLQDRT